MKTQIHSLNKPYYGWLIVAACFITSFGGVSIIINAMGTFIKPVSQALNMERSALSACVSATSICSTLSLLLWGEYFRRRGHRGAMIISGTICPILIFSMAFCTKLWHFFLASAALGLLYGPIASLSVTSLLSQWFSRNKGAAIGIAGAGSGLGSMCVIPLISAVCERNGYRVAYMTAAFFFLLTVLPVSVFIIRDKLPERDLASGMETQAELNGMTRLEALKSRSFPAYLCFSLINGCLYGGMLNHLYAYLTDLGRTAAVASGALSVLMAALFVSKLCVGCLYDKFGARLCLTGETFCYALCFAALLALPAGAPLCAGPVLGGLAASTGAVGIAMTSMCLYGNREYPAIHSIVSSVYMAGVSLGTLLNGLIFDLSGGYKAAWMTDLVGAGICLGLCLIIFRRNAKCAGGC